MSRKTARESAPYQFFLWEDPNWVGDAVEDETKERAPSQVSREEPVDEADRALQEASVQACGEWAYTRTMAVKTAFYPYIDLKSTLRIQQNQVNIRVSNHLMDAPHSVLYALTHILLARAMRKKPARQYLSAYETYIHNMEPDWLVERESLTRKQLAGPVGMVYDLEAVFAQVNHDYFNKAIPKPNLSWSPRRSWRRLGYHDPHLNLIVISRSLDRPKVPRYMVEYVMFHELLHILMPAEYRNGKRYVHTPAFKKEERKFKNYKKVMHWLRKKAR